MLQGLDGVYVPKARCEEAEPAVQLPLLGFPASSAAAPCEPAACAMLTG